MHVLQRYYQQLYLQEFLDSWNSFKYSINYVLYNAPDLKKGFNNINNSEFSYLKGYKNGPVFSNVYGDYTKERKTFDKEVENVYVANRDMVDNEIENKAKFLVRVLTEKELSTLSHKMNIWNSKEKQISNGESQVILNESDLNENDFKIVEDIDKMFLIEFIQNHDIVSVGKNHFAFANNDISKITENQIDTLYELSTKEELENPVYVKINERGIMEID